MHYCKDLYKKTGKVEFFKYTNYSALQFCIFLLFSVLLLKHFFIPSKNDIPCSIYCPSEGISNLASSHRVEKKQE